MAALSKSEKNALKSMDVDQRLVCDAYHSGLLRYELQSSQIDGDHERARHIKNLLCSKRRESLRLMSDDTLLEIKNAHRKVSGRRISASSLFDPVEHPDVNVEDHSSLRSFTCLNSSNLKKRNNSNKTVTENVAEIEKDSVGEDLTEGDIPYSSNCWHRPDSEDAIILPAITITLANDSTTGSDPSNGDTLSDECKDDGHSKNQLLVNESHLQKARQSAPNILSLPNPDGILKLAKFASVPGFTQRPRRHSMGHLVRGRSSSVVEIDLDERVKGLCAQLEEKKTNNDFYDADYYTSRMLERK